MYRRIAAGIGIILFAAAMGYFLGESTAPHRIVSTQTHSESDETSARLDHGFDESRSPEFDPPVYFYAGVGPEADLALVAAEIGMATQSGIHRFVLTAELPWMPEDHVEEHLIAHLGMVREKCSNADILLSVSTNPSPAWMARNPDEAVVVSGQRLSYASVESSAWFRAVEAGFEKILSAIAGAKGDESVSGFVITGLERGSWYNPSNYDTSSRNLQGFRSWLATRYNDETIQRAWNDATITVQSATIPLPLATDDTHSVFLKVPDMQPHVDYHRYASQAISHTIGRIATRLKEMAGRPIQVLAPYGFSFEQVNNSSGHYDLEFLLYSEVDGFVSPVSYIDRGLGGAGGYMGPIGSVLSHGKTWTIIDDTRSGITKDPQSGQVLRAAGLRAQDVFNVYRRNFAAAMTRGLGLCWADPSGQGALHDADTWKLFGEFKRLYAHEHGVAPAPSVHDLRPFEKSILTIVVDETSRFYQQCDAKLNELLLVQGRDAAARSGVVTQYCLLADVVSDRTLPSSVYVFLNAFYLSEKERQLVHEKLQREQAAAVWLYAPGYLSDTAVSAENISLTTGMTVRAFDGPALSGSVSKLNGRYLAQDREFGNSAEWQPLFYVDDESVDVLAAYKQTDKPSIGFKAGEKNWISIFIAEPFLDVRLLRELLALLEIPSFAESSASGSFDTMHFGLNMIGIHASGEGERVLELRWLYDVVDLFHPEVGWVNKHRITIPLNEGDTRLLKLKPVSEENVG